MNSPLTKDKIHVVDGGEAIHPKDVLSAVEGLREELCNYGENTPSGLVRCGEFNYKCMECQSIDKHFPAFTDSCSHRNTEETSDGDKYVDCQEQTGTSCSRPTSSVSDRVAVRAVDESEQDGSDPGEKSGTSLSQPFVRQGRADPPQSGDAGELSLGGQSSDVDALSDVKDAGESPQCKSCFDTKKHWHMKPQEFYSVPCLKCAGSV